MGRQNEADDPLREEQDRAELNAMLAILESVLAREWLSPEEDAAWVHL